MGLSWLPRSPSLLGVHQAQQGLGQGCAEFSFATQLSAYSSAYTISTHTLVYRSVHQAILSVLSDTQRVSHLHYSLSKYLYTTRIQYLFLISRQHESHFIIKHKDVRITKTLKYYKSDVHFLIFLKSSKTVQINIKA